MALTGYTEDLEEERDELYLKVREVLRELVAAEEELGRVHELLQAEMEEAAKAYELVGRLVVENRRLRMEGG